VARKQGHNREHYEDRLKNAINIALRRDLADPRFVMVSVTRVELTQDYSIAKVYWDTYDATKRGDLKKALQGVSSKLRSILAKELNVRHTPELKLKYDSQFEDERNIENLINDND
jgi:ribosome-binding factor A